MREREIVKLLLQIEKSLYLVNKKRDCALRGTLMDIGGRPGMRLESGEIVNVDPYLPIGESGTLLWILGDVNEVDREI